MLRYTLKRLGLAFLVALSVSIIAFSLVRLSGDVATAIAGEAASQADIEAVREKYGLDRPIPIQYLEWLGNIARGDLGESLYFQTPAKDVILARLPTTLTLGLLALCFAIIVAIPLGVIAALWPNSWVD